MKARSEPRGLRYSPDHIWIDSDGRVGVSHHLARWLPTIVAVHLPAPGDAILIAQPFAAIEADKGLFDLYAPCDARVLDLNLDVVRDPQRVNADPYGDGWLVRVDGDASLLLTPARYRARGGALLPPFRRWAKEHG